ncbi:MAG: hypothetical protein ABIN72_08225 [Sphingomicrobium sp.]
MRRALVLVAAVALASCGKVADLEPAKGQPLPVKPMMARTTPTPEDLLTPPTYARADRIDELLKKSEPRQADRFDLPPATGGEAPAAPAGTLEVPVSDDQGPTDPESTRR